MPSPRACTIALKGLKAAPCAKTGAAVAKVRRACSFARAKPAIKRKLSSCGRSGLGDGAGSRSPTRTEVRSPTSTSTEVRSPTSTSTEVRSPTSTSTDAYTAGNVTVTGGAGAGANTTVHIYPGGRVVSKTSKAGKAARREMTMMARAGKTGKSSTGASQRERRQMANQARTGKARPTRRKSATSKR